MNKLNALSKCKTMLTHAKKNRLWESSKMSEIIDIRYNQWLTIEKAPDVNKGKTEWSKWIKKSEHAIKEMKKTMHLKHRIEFRKQISTFAAAIEKSRLESTTCKKFFSYIADSSFTPPAKQLHINGEWVRGKLPILTAEDENADKHMSGRDDSFHYDLAQSLQERDDVRLGKDIITNPFCALNDEGRKMRKALAENTSD